MAQKHMKDIKLSLPGETLEIAKKRFLEPLDEKRFYGKPSQSKLIRALVELAVEAEGVYHADEILDYEGLKEALRSLLSEPSKPGGK